MAAQNITKKCKACELNFKKKTSKPNSGFHLPKDIPVSKEMKDAINVLRGNKK